MDYGTLPTDPISAATATALAHLKDVATAAAAVACKECLVLDEVHRTKTGEEYSVAVNHAVEASAAELDKAFLAFKTSLREAVLKHGDGIAATGDVAHRAAVTRARETSGPKDVVTPRPPAAPREDEQPRGPGSDRFAPPRR